jgi:hypothetical protein
LLLCLTTESRESKNLFIVTSTSTYLHESSEFNESTRNSDLPFFDLNIIVAATDNFSVANKLGEGGFGPVYKVVSLKMSQNLSNFSSYACVNALDLFLCFICT